MIELFGEINRCDEVFSLADRGIGEGPRLDYKKTVELTRSGKKELAKDVSALANAQGGLLVVGVKDPAREGDPPRRPDDFLGVKIGPTLVRDLESSLLGSISPPVYASVKATSDEFEHPESGEMRGFLIIAVPQGSQLHQVTAGGDFRFYRRAYYQNRPMSEQEIRERMAAVASARQRIDELFKAERERTEMLLQGQPRVVFLAAPALPHRFATDPALPEVREKLTEFGRRHSGWRVNSPIELESPLSSNAEFIPAGDGARSVQRLSEENARSECRVRQDSLITDAQHSNDLEDELLLQRHSHPDELWEETPEHERRSNQSRAEKRAEAGYPSSVVSPAPAVRLRPPILRRRIRGFLQFIRETYELGGYYGPLRFEVQIAGTRRYVAVGTQPAPGPRFYRLSEQTDLSSAMDLEYEALASREEELADEMLRRLSWHFGIDRFAL